MLGALFRLILILTLGLSPIGCSLIVDIDGQNYNSPTLNNDTAAPSEEVTALWVTGENDSTFDQILKASSTATVTWNGRIDGNYLVTVLDATGVIAICPEQPATGFTLVLTNCDLEDHSTYKVRVIPADANFVGLYTPKTLFEITTDKLRWNPSALTLIPNQTITLQILDGTPAFTFSGSPRLNTSTLAYSVPVSNPGAGASEVLMVTDQSGSSAELAIDILNFVDTNNALADAPRLSSITAPKEAVLANDGSLLMTDYLETARWQYDYNVLRSTDKGASATLVDYFIPSINQPTLSRAITKAPNGDIYSCAGGYTATSDFAVIRKSTDNGVTWTTGYLSPTDEDESCYDVTVNSQGWILYVGLAANAALGENGVVRLSKDQGATWQTIYKDGGIFFEAEFAPDDSIWIFGSTQTAHIVRFIKGKYDGVNWNFTTFSNPAGLTNTYFSTQWSVWSESGDYEFENANHAFFVGANGFDLLETTDGGVTWSKAFTMVNAFGQNVLRLADGTLLISGGSLLLSDNQEAVILRKGPADLDFSEVLRIPETSYSNQYCGPLVRYPDGDIIALCQKRGWPEPAVTYRSSDNGVTWTVQGYTGWGQVFDMLPRGYFQTSSGDVLASFTGAHSSGAAIAFLGKLSFGTQVWSELSTIVNSENNADPSMAYDRIELLNRGPANIYYAIGDNAVGPNSFLYISTDSGAHWTLRDAPKDGGSSYIEFNELMPLTANKLFLFSRTAGGRLDVVQTTDQGVSYSIRFSFPTGTSTKFIYEDSLVAADGAVWVSGIETDSSLVEHENVYRSTDQGVSWSLVHSAAMSTSNVRIVQIANGDIFISGNNIYRTSDQGTQWDVIPTPTSITDFIVFDDQRIVIQSDWETWMQTYTPDKTWLMIEDINNFTSTHLDIDTTGQIFKIGPKTFGIPYSHVDMKTGYEFHLKTMTLP